MRAASITCTLPTTLCWLSCRVTRREFYWNVSEVSRTSDNFWAYMHYTLATVEGLHLTCDFVVYSAALYGCPPNYSPTPVGLQETYGQPHEILGSVPFEAYQH